MRSNDFWRTLFDPRGRRSRAGFWAYAGLSIVAFLVCSFVGDILGLMLPSLSMVVFLLTLLAMFVGSLINAIRRLHDLGHSGWWMALFAPVQLLLALAAFGGSDSGGSPINGLQALIGLALLIWLGGFAGQPDANRFGEPPLTRSEPVAV
jgi:uncharacterized membrane protein YhaH (DUF805 family)